MVGLHTFFRECCCAVQCSDHCKAATLNLLDNTIVPIASAASIDYYMTAQTEANQVFARCTSTAGPAQTFKFIFHITEENRLAQVLSVLLQRVIAFATSRCDSYSQYFAIKRGAINAFKGPLREIIRIFQSSLVYIIITTRSDDLSAGEAGKRIHAMQKQPYACHLKEGELSLCSAVILTMSRYLVSCSTALILSCLKLDFLDHCN